METLTLGKPLATTEPVVALDATLPPGVYRVELVVQGSSTGKSAVATLLITIVKE
ncbi:MAG: hypothetical protein IPG93_04650 [Burkholderiales bacterium]|nr:hypothetical protein [Burkholderiales bacterium]